MKGFKWLLIMLIGMVGLTGFSTTTDLTKDSIMVTVDNDVGVDVAVTVLVEANAVLIKGIDLFSSDYSMFEQHREIQMFNTEILALERPYTNDSQRNLLVPLRLSTKILKATRIKNYKMPRDGLNC